MKMTSVARQEVLGLYRRIFRIAKKWQSASGQMEDTIKEKQYIINEAKTLFQKNKDLTDPELIKQCIEECKARVEIGLHYHIPYPRPVSVNPDNVYNNSSASSGSRPTTWSYISKPRKAEEAFQASLLEILRRSFITHCQSVVHIITNCEADMARVCNCE
ncbi:LYR motif-containing protein 1 isoform X2 [Caretta caretta]|uniref:LYR motif-containing protein 1 isoform X2 n=1 Tax=Caretta caretta TaxID=8467 RepID=UPI003F4C5B05